jgi:tripartite-type tricarboxylate transporter receptor subunit TctC
MFDNLTSSMQHVREGRLKMLAVTTEKRLPDLPDTPTIAETLPNFVSATWVGVFLPPKTPQAIAAQLNADFNEGLKQPDVAKRFRDNGSEPFGTTPQAAADFVRGEAARWATVIKAAGIKSQ